MGAGFRGWMIGLGLFCCGAFAGAFYLGGWIAFGVAAGCSLLAAVGASFIAALPEVRLRKAMDDLGEHCDPETALCELGKGELSQSLCRLAGGMARYQQDSLFYQEALKGLNAPVLILGSNGNILRASQAFLTLLNKPANRVVGSSVALAISGHNGDSVADRVLRSGKSAEEEIQYTFEDGRTLNLRLAAVPIKDADGDVKGVVCSVADQTEALAQQLEIDEQRASMARAGEQLSGLAEHVASATELLSASADDQAQGAQKQRNQTTAVATAMEQMTGTVLEVARNANATSDAASQAHESANEGVGMVNSAVAAINEVADSAKGLASEITQLNVQAEEIGRIISVINDIADQTNLLALNAAIEAARAGDAGRGFAVVADEVRKLAEKTVAATKEVEEAIGTIQQRSRHATEAMNQTEQQVASSTDLSNQAGNALQTIMESINDMVGRVSQIATAAEQQSSAAEEINSSIEDIALIASDADEAAGQAAHATRDLAGLAQELLDVSKNFRDGGGENLLRESEGEMKGILPKLTQDFVRSTYGDEVFEGMNEAMGMPVFLPTDSYPDQVLMQMSELVSAQTGVSTREFFLDLGNFTVVRFHEMYPSYFKNESLKEFYLRMNDIHAQLTKDQPGIKPPGFTYEDKGDDLFMNYRSQRGLFDYFEGILLGAARFKGERVTIHVKPFDDTTARAEIVFHGKN
ncbi:methyl-accepting chemotaxis protein [Pseudodesulfovibrio sp. zrk46]|uniref:methyl-accepting chemotaxis protein n=1 Tax=Pseudodesulfovibrio sp. zrk46 TaxID=2725288 RepID=UPI001449FC87|nr:methyl-accepting chemotaxis protein [Pseudodesulfovibrio sp. zrk46]QJB57885.1 PAS domain-containing protein [Pseudodesulfovibrio sp. zrk46]